MARTLKEALAARAAGLDEDEPADDIGPKDLERIQALPSRPPVECEPDPRRWPGPRHLPPVTVALIEMMTQRYGRGSRLSCACRPRQVTAGIGGAIVIVRVLPPGEVPLPPIITTVAAFVADNRTTKEEVRAAHLVVALRPGEEVSLPAADGLFGHPCIVELNALQAWGLREARSVSGVVGYCGPGSGKTILGLLVPLVFSDCKLAVILAEPGQRRHYRSFYLRLREHFRVPSIRFDDEGESYTVLGTPPLHFIPYSKLSQKTSTDLLDRYAPDVVVGDEAHRVAGESSRARRLKRYLATARCRVCRKCMPRRDKGVEGWMCLDCGPAEPLRIRHLPWSGTFESDSVEDSQALAGFSLGDGSPMPLDPEVAKAWSAVMDPLHQRDRSSTTYKALLKAFGNGGITSSPAPHGMPAAIARMLGDPEEEIRRGFCRRRNSTPGIISMNAGSVNAALFFTERPAPKLPDAVREALRGVRGTAEEESHRPDGDLFDTVVERVECAKHVGAGFYNYWAFPKHPCAATIAGTCEPVCKQCQLIADWYLARKEYKREVRSRMLRDEAHLDSPDLCWHAAERFWREPPYTGDQVKWASEKWPAWSKIKDRVEHDERVRWIDDFLAQDAAKWALEHRGIVWCQSVAFGQRVAQLARLPYHGGGPNAEAAIMAETGARSIVASIKAHGSGRDGLQNKFNEQLIAEMPASNLVLEQLLGRLHRPGQRAPIVKTAAYLHLSEFMDALRQCIAQAEFVESTTGNKQKISLADKDVDGL